MEQKKTFLDDLTSFQIHLLGIVVTLCISIYSFYDFLIFKSLYLYTDIGSDTVNLFWPNFVSTANNIREYGLPTWSFQQGMGQNTLAFTVGDPFNWILYAAGSKYIPYAIVYVEVLKIIMAGSFFLAFLKQLRISNFSSLVGSLSYAFSGFMIVGSGWYIFSSEAVLFAFLLLSFEHLYQAKKKWLFPIAVCFLGAYNPFNWFTYGLLLWLYASWRYFSYSDGDFREYTHLIGKMMGMGLLGVGMSAFISTSSILEMLGSARVSGDAGYYSVLKENGLFYVDRLNYYATIVFRFFSSDLQGTGSSFRGWNNYLEAPAFYAGLLTILLATQYIIQIGKTQKRLLLYFGAVIILPAFIPLFRYSIWLFSGNYFRGYSLWVVFVMILFAAKALDGILKGAKINPYLLFSVLVPAIIILAYPFSHFEASGKLRFFIIAGLLLYTIALYLLSTKKLFYPTQIFMLFLIGIEFSSASKITATNRTFLSTGDLHKKINYNDYTVDAIKYLKDIDPDFFRIDKAYASGPSSSVSYNDAKMQDYYGTSSYYSFNQGSYINFLDKMGAINANSDYQTRWSIGLKNRPILQTWASTKYLLFQNGSIVGITGYHKIKEIGGIEIWENNHFLPLGFTCNIVIAEREILSLSPQQKDIVMMKAVVVENEKRDIFNNLKTFQVNSIPANYTIDLLEKDISRLKENTLEITEFKEKQIEGKIDLSEQKILVLSIPYDKGWKAIVNGKKVIIHKINFGQTGILLSPGVNHLALSYKPRYFYLSIVVSIISIFILMFIVIKPR